MPEAVSYTEARANLASIWDRVVSEREPVWFTDAGKKTWPSCLRLN